LQQLQKQGPFSEPPTAIVSPACQSCGTTLKSVDLAAKVVDRFKDGRKRVPDAIVGLIKITLSRQKTLRRHGVADLAPALCRHKHA